MKAVDSLALQVGTAPACRALGISRATWYRRRKPCSQTQASERPGSHRALSPPERQQVLQTLNSERFMNQTPAQVYATLLDEGVYLCSQRTMYRLLAQAAQVRERRNQLRHPVYQKPQLLATQPNEVWTWDITKLRGPAKWVYYYLYVILDIYSRYVVGWMVAACESAALAQRLIQESCEKQQIVPGQLSIHADRGASMMSKTLEMLMADLGILKSHSRPHVSDDNPYSEAQFRTLKYCPTFPNQFGCEQDARAFCQEFFAWYNQEHRHSGIGLMTPEAVHYGKWKTIWENRQRVLLSAYQAHPERFLKQPVPLVVPSQVWINPPARPSTSEEALQ